MRDMTTKAMAYVMAMTMLAKFTGFLREAVIAANFGVSSGTDAYFIAQTLPHVLFAVVGASMGEVFLPIYMERQNLSGQLANQFANTIINISLIATSVISLICIALSPHIIKILAPGFDREGIYVSSSLFRIMAFSFTLTSLSYMLAGILQSHSRHTMPALISIPSNVSMIIISLMFGERYGVYALAWGAIIGAAMQVVVQIPFVKDIYVYRPYMDINTHITKFFSLLLPVILGKAVDEVNYIVDKILASTLHGGSISAINYVIKLVNFGAGMVISGLILVLYPIFSQLSIEGDYGRLSNSIEQAIEYVIYAVVPITVIAFMHSNEIVGIVFQRGAFGDLERNLTSYAFKFYILGMGAICIREILNRAFFAIQDTKLPMKLGVGAMVLNVFLNLSLVRKFHIAGLGIATSISNILLTSMLYYYLRKSIGYDRKRRIYIYVLYSLMGAFISGLVMYITRPYYSRYSGDLLSFIISSMLGISVYILILHYTRRRMGIMVKKLRLMDITDYPVPSTMRAPVSVVIPCYCCADTIDKAVESVWKQTWRPYEVILVEDSSKDHGATRMALSNIIDRYPGGWIKLILLDKNKGPGNARNIGWEASTQRYIAFLDADDMWHPQKIEIQLKCMLMKSDVCISAHLDTKIDSLDLELDHVPLYHGELVGIKIRDITATSMLIKNHIYTSSVMIDKNRVYFRFKPDKYYSEDYLLWLSIIISGQRAMRIELPLYYVWEAMDKVSLSKNLWEMEKGEIESYRSIYKAGFIGSPTFVLFNVFSAIKYIKRLMTHYIKRLQFIIYKERNNAKS